MPIAAPDTRPDQEAQNEPVDKESSGGMTRGQGHLILLLLAANLLVSLIGWDGALSGIAIPEEGGEQSFGMSILTGLGWVLIATGAALVIGGAMAGAFVWWSRRQLGRLTSA